MRRLTLLTLVPLVACSKAPTGTPPHQIHIAGSSAGFLLSTQVAERLMREAPDVLAPLVRAGGTGEGIARFCDKENPTRPDILIATRRMTPEEQARCVADGSGAVEQKEIGTTAIVLVEAKGGPPFPSLTRIDISKALTSNAKTWADVRPGLPAIPIVLHGPTPSPGIADTLYGPFLQKDQNVRTDGAYTGHGADAAMVVRVVAEKPGAIGIVPLGQALARRDMVMLVPIDGREPAEIGSATRPTRLFLVYRASDASVPGLDRLLGYYRDALERGREDIAKLPVIN